VQVLAAPADASASVLSGVEPIVVPVTLPVVVPVAPAEGGAGRAGGVRARGRAARDGLRVTATGSEEGDRGGQRRTAACIARELTRSRSPLYTTCVATSAAGIERAARLTASDPDRVDSQRLEGVRFSLK
jgi:hypothetical protein